MNILDKLLTGAFKAENAFDKLRWNYLRRNNRIGPLIIHTYLGLGDQEKATISGRLLEKRNISPARRNNSYWANLKAMYQRFESNEVPGASIQAEFYGKSYEVLTDREGYFQFTFQVPDRLDHDLFWHSCKFTLTDSIGKNQGPVSAEGKILIAHPKANFGIISDIDDTVLRTEATRLLKMLKNTFLYNARTRLPFKGVAAFYKALHQGEPDNPIKNPLYYVSSSPWNLYDMLQEFLQIQEIPVGPLMLRDFGLSDPRSEKKGHRGHKLEQIERILSFSGQLPFILIGDSGQKDPEIYLEVVRRFPRRVKAIYIREVHHQQRNEQIKEFIEAQSEIPIDVLLVPDTEAAAAHALSKGYISQNAYQAVQTDKQDDQAAAEATPKPDRPQAR